MREASSSCTKSTRRSRLVLGTLSLALALGGIPVLAEPAQARPAIYSYVDDEGVVHEIDQGEGGEQGDAMMPLLFALGQHNALSEVQNQFAACAMSEH